MNAHKIVVFKQLLMKLSTRTSPSNDIDHDCATQAVQTAGGALSTRTASRSCLLPARAFIVLSPCLANHLFDVNSQNTDLAYHIQLAS